jgi:hypothetical protein
MSGQRPELTPIQEMIRRAFLEAGRQVALELARLIDIAREDRERREGQR